jgi:hypothetical protein
MSCRRPSDLRRGYDWILRALFDLALNLKCVPSIFESGCSFTLSGSIPQRRRSNAPTNTRRKHHTHRVDPFWLCLCKCLWLSSVAASHRSVFVRSNAAVQRKSPSRSKQASTQPQTQARTDTGGATPKSPIGYDISTFVANQRCFRFASVHSSRAVLKRRLVKNFYKL